MKLLAWDTSTKVGALVAIEGEGAAFRVASEFTLDVNRTHSERLLWGVHQVLQSLDWKLDDVSSFGVGLGPGSFTGLRIGLMTAKTLAHTLKRPLIGVSSLGALAYPVAQMFSEEDVLVLAVTEACQGEVYALWGKAADVCQVASLDVSTGESSTGKVTEGCYLIEELKEALKSYLDAHPTFRWIAIGSAKDREEWLPKETSVLLKGLFLDQIQGRYLGQLVWDSFQAKGKTEMNTEGALKLAPRYLRVSNAEKKRWQV